MNPINSAIFTRRGLIHSAAKAMLGLSLLAMPSVLSAQTLQHRYSFVSDASDSVGTANGSVVAPSGGTAVKFSNGLTLAGGGGPGFSGFVTLPGGILNTTTNVTVEFWASQSAANTWAETWSFNSGTPSYWAFISDGQNNNNNLEQALRLNNNETDSQSGIGMPGTETHFTVTYNSTNLVDTIWEGQSVIASATVPSSAYTPGVQNFSTCFIGQDPWPDPQWQGTIYEFRIYNGTLDSFQIAVDDVAGSTNVVSNFTPSSAVLAFDSTNLVLSGSAQGTVDVTLAATTTNIFNANIEATNWVSSNPGVVQVNSSGVITAVGLGTATVRATVHGVTATSSTVFVTAPPTLVHRYSFVSDASDSVGGANGTLVAPNGGTNATIANGLVLPGGGGPGHSGYVTLPAGILTNTTSLTIECWTLQNNGNTWGQIFNFGNSQSQNIGLIPLPGRDNGNLEFAVSPNGGEIDTVSGIHFPTNSEQYVSFVFDSSALKSALYDNGKLLATQSFPNRTYIPGSFGGAAGTANNVFGQDPFPDNQYQGTVYEFRIWNGALSAVYEAAAAAAGPSVIITNTVPTLLNIGLTTTSMIGSGTQQATVTANFIQVSSVDVTGGATNWVSSNPNVLTVSSSGLITGVNGGTATVSATVSGVTATSATITVASTPPVFTLKPANVTAAVNDNNVTFSTMGLGGNLNYQWSFDGNPISGATNTTLVLNNVALTNSGTYSVLISNNLGTTNASATLNVAQAVLLHRYSFVSDASDSVGHANGTIIGPNGGTAASINNGLTLPGGGGGGFSGYVAFPTGILTNTTSLTVECWVTQNTAQEWATVWDFANDGNHNFEMCPFPQRGILNLDVAITPHGNEIDTITGNLFPSGQKVYTAFTFNVGNLTANIYTNGNVSGTQVYPDATYIPGTIGAPAGTSQNWLGNDTYGDTQFQGTIYEFRIWDGAQSPLYLEISAAAGAGVVVTNLTPTSISVSVTNNTMVQGLSQPASATGNFADASGVNITGSVTNWTSSNTNILKVSSSGLVTAVGTGSATISATLNGTTGASSTISVPTSPPIITQQPAASDTFLQGATLTATVANVGTSPFVYRWFFNNGTTPISTSSNPTLMIPNVQPTSAGTYTVLVSNLDGSVLSSQLVVSVIAATTYEQAVLQYGPIAYWPLQETDGTTAYDVVGADNGTYTTTSITGSSFSLGNPGPSQSFFGGSSLSAGFLSAIVDIPEGNLNITGPVTITAWVQQETAAQFGGVVGHGDQSWRLAITQNGAPGDGLAAGNSGSSQADATAPTSANINDDNWHMLVYTYTGNTSQPNNGLLYVDGALVASNTIATPPPGDNLDVWIGGAPDYGTQRLLPAANIAHVAIFNQSFTGAQVQGLYNGTYVLGPQLIQIAKASGNNIVLNWQTGTLLQSTNILGPWTTNSTATSPYTIPATNKAAFFKLLVSP
ncbi:MAG TPA: LamG-like jellyroll fold domain-containing protein [Pseudomonadales bacterium]|nr:LamG-like jellyroll fold domain-containing protein [Pseudomonadales bacterium]